MAHVLAKAASRQVIHTSSPLWDLECVDHTVLMSNSAQQITPPAHYTKTTLRRFVNARRQRALNHAVAENPGRRGRSSAAAKSTLFSSEGAKLAVFLPKTRFRVGGVANGISDFLVKKPIDRIEELVQAACKLMFTSFPLHSEAIQQLLQTWLFQHANASQSSNVHCGRRGTGMDALVIALIRT